MNKTIRTLKAALAAITLGVFATAGLQAQLIYNGTFNITNNLPSAGSTQGWTLDGTVTNPWDGIYDFVEIRSGGSVRQDFGDGTLAGIGSFTIGSAGDYFEVEWDMKTVWNNPTMVLTLFTDGNPSNVVATQSYPLSGSFGPWNNYSFGYTASASDVGKTLGVMFSSGGVYADDRFVGVTNISASVAPIPEPSTYALLGLGLGALVWLRRRTAKA